MADSDLDPDMQAVLSGSTPAAQPTPSESSTGDPDMDAVLASSQSASSPSWVQTNVTRPLKLAARNAIEGITALPVLAGNAGIQAGNLLNNHVLPHFGLPAPSNELQPVNVPQMLTRFGMPTNDSALERGVGFLESGMAGAAGLPSPSVGMPEVPTSPLTGAQQSALQQGAQVGMRPTPGQAAGSVPQQQIEAYLESHPWTSGPAATIKASNQVALNRAWAQQIGEDSGSVDSTVLARANDRLGAVFDSVRDQTPRALDQPTVTAGLQQLDSDYAGLLPNNAKVTDHPLVQQLADLASNGTATGQQLGALSSKLGKAAAKQMTQPSGDRDLGLALFQVKDGVDDAVAQGLAPDQLAEYNGARSQYRSLMQLTGRAGNVNPTTGDVNGQSMASYLQAKDRPGYLFNGNQSPAYQATRFAQAFKPVVGNSGTATRELGVTDLWQLPYGIPLNAASRLYYKTGLPDLAGATRGLLEGAPGASASAEDQ